jgi:hypothetical protein
VARVAPDYARPCRRKLHTIPAGALTCPECEAARERAKNERKKARHSGTVRRGRPPDLSAALDRSGFPPIEVLDGAACSLEIAYLFDPAESKRKGVTYAETADRHAAAMMVCARCPVADACLADAYEHRRLGVYGGQVFDPAFWLAESLRRGIPLVQSMQGVPESPAC